jgi:hypothetical protein
MKTDDGNHFLPTPNCLWPHALSNAFDDPATYRFTFKFHGGGYTDAMAVEVNWNGKWDAVSGRQVNLFE